MADRKRKPIVAVVGRPNVGKSTLFNALAGEKIAIVKDTPGITRDRIYADITWLDMNFTLIDTGGIEPDSKDIILSQMREQAQIAIDTADVIIFLTDVKQGLVDSDSKVADMLRRSGKPVVLVVNKVDSILNVWFLGTLSGHAIEKLIYGKENPNGKLTMSFPYTVGQVPVFYNTLNTGRPYDGVTFYTSHYLDIPNHPLYPFGYGLSYSNFEYSNLKIENKNK